MEVKQKCGVLIRAFFLFASFKGQDSGVEVDVRIRFESLLMQRNIRV